MYRALTLPHETRKSARQSTSTISKITGSNQLRKVTRTWQNGDQAADRQASPHQVEAHAVLPQTRQYLHRQELLKRQLHAACPPLSVTQHQERSLPPVRQRPSSSKTLPSKLRRQQLQKLRKQPQKLVQKLGQQLQKPRQKLAQKQEKLQQQQRQQPKLKIKMMMLSQPQPRPNPKTA